LDLFARRKRRPLEIAGTSDPGDDDRNVPFQQTIDLARRLEARRLPFEELVMPDEITGSFGMSPG